MLMVTDNYFKALDVPLSLSEKLGANGTAIN
jgi:hypothetical protein